MKTMLIIIKAAVLLTLALAAYLASAVALGVSPYGEASQCAGVVAEICAVIIM